MSRLFVNYIRERNGCYYPRFNPLGPVPNEKCVSSKFYMLCLQKVCFPLSRKNAYLQPGDLLFVTMTESRPSPVPDISLEKLPQAGGALANRKKKPL